MSVVFVFKRTVLHPPVGGGRSRKRDENYLLRKRKRRRRFVYFRLTKMAQGTHKFKAQRPGASKKQQNKQKGPKKGGMSSTYYPLDQE